MGSGRLVKMRTSFSNPHESTKTSVNHLSSRGSIGFVTVLAAITCTHLVGDEAFQQGSVSKTDSRSPINA